MDISSIKQSDKKLIHVYQIPFIELENRVCRLLNNSCTEFYVLLSPLVHLRIPNHIKLHFSLTFNVFLLNVDSLIKEPKSLIYVRVTNILITEFHCILQTFSAVFFAHPIGCAGVP